MRIRTPAVLAFLGALAPLGPASLADTSNTMRVGELHFGHAYDILGWARPLPASDEDGLSLLHPDMLRTPSGALYPYPPPPRLFDESLDGWTYEASAGFGYAGVFGDGDALFFRQYTDWDDDFLAEFALDLEQGDTGNYVELRGSRLNEKNRFFRVRAGRAGDYRVDAFYRDVPHIVSTTAHPIWEGVGTETLTLPDGLVPGGSPVEDVAAASETTPAQTIRVDRSRAGLSVEGDVTKRWIGFASLTNEEREGTRLWGGSMFFAFIPDNGGVNETVRPIDFTTTDLSVGARFAGNTWRINTMYTGSFFRNHEDRLDYESPFILSTVLGPEVPPAGVISQGQFSLEPDNDYHNVRVEASRSIRWNGELSLAASVGTMRQDDRLRAPVSCTGMGGIFIPPATDFTFDCADWNTTAALSTDTADARIDTHMLDVRAAFRPGSLFGWRARLRHEGENNRTSYLSFNPLTGQYGYISENGSQGSVVPGETGIFDPDDPLYASYNVPVRNMPFEFTRTLAELGGDWQPGMRHTVSATYTFERYEPEHRERDRVDEQRLALAWTWRLPSDASLRLGYEIADRTGDEYEYDPYEPFYSTSIPGFVTPPGGVIAHTVDAMRKHDLADRRQNRFRAVFVQPIGLASTVSATLYGNYNDYEATIGQRGAWTTGTTVQWDYQPGPATNLSAYAGYDDMHTRVANVADDEAALTSDPTLGGPTYPLANRWYEDDREDGYHAGVTLAHDFGRFGLDASYSLVATEGDVSYAYESIGAVAGTQQPFPENIGSAFPQNEYRVHALDVSLSRALTQYVTARVFARYEMGEFSDFHYAGFQDALVYDHRVYTDRGPAREYDAGVVGLMFDRKL
jgi:hypothetical protein